MKTIIVNYYYYTSIQIFIFYLVASLFLIISLLSLYIYIYARYVSDFQHEGVGVYRPYQKFGSRWYDKNLGEVNAIYIFNFYFVKL
jgi:hypothetical protein